MSDTLGYTLNHGQKQAEAEIDESVKSRRHHLLTGDAGAGKTVLIQVVAAKLRRRRKSVICTAPTHQACSVLRRKLQSTGIDVEVITTHSLLGLKPVPKGDRLVFVHDDKAGTVYSDVVIIDETSMIGTDLFEHIERHLKGRSVIFSGDPHQLNPVGEGESPTFATEHHSHLSEPVRQALGNPILQAAWAVAKAQSGDLDWSWIKPAHNAPYGVYQPQDPEIWMRKAFTSDEFNTDSLSHRYLCWTNKRVAEVNRMVREWRYGRVDTPFVSGERALVRAPLMQKKTIVLNTNEEVTVKSISQSGYRGLQTWALELETEDRGEVTAHTPQNADAYQARLSKLADDARSGRGSWKQFHGFKDALITIQAPYALTVHNCQGLTLRNAHVDMPEMRRWVRSNRDEGLRGIYVAITRPSHALMLVGK